MHHLVPRIDPSDGLYAYALRLAGDPSLLISSSSALGAAPEIGELVLHYSGYGYAANGIPHRLVQDLCYWRQAVPGRRLLVVFHELFARQPPWRKGFWWAPLQRRLLRRLITCCDGGFSNLELHSHWLRHHGLEPFATLPVPSNVGETSVPLSLSERAHQLVVFGGRSQRLAAHAALRRHPSLLARLGITAVHDVGPPLDPPLAPSQSGLPVHCHGLLPEAEVATLLSQSQLAAVSYPLPFLAKSGIFAAICAHGALPLVLNAGPRAAAQADGLRASYQFITPSWLQDHLDPIAALAAGQAISTAAWQWYQSHRLSEQRRLFQAWIAAQR
jgi:hypothetical protein